MSPVKYELGSYIPEDDILHSHCFENLKSCIGSTAFLLNVVTALIANLPINLG
jgi:hypothetical protein